MAKPKSQHIQNGIHAHLEPEPGKKRWRKKYGKAPHVHPNNNGNFYFINGTTPNPMYLPSLPQEEGDAGGRYPGQNTMNGNPAGYQPYFHPGSGDTWAVDRNGMNGANVNMNVNPNPNANMSANVMAAQIDDFEDQEKRLFLEEFRYPGQHPQYEPPCCDHSFAGPKPDRGMMMEAVNTDKTATASGGDKGLASKLRGDAPEFVPTQKSNKNSESSDGNSSGWTIVTSW